MPVSPHGGLVPPLAPGDRVAVVAPGSTPPDAGKLREGIARLEALGLVVEIAPNVLQCHGYLAGDDRTRLTAFNTYLQRPDVKALFCARGGYGCLRLLPHLDYSAARRHPKLLIGYSDITALHLAFYRMAGWRGLSGPMVGVEWGNLDAESERLFLELARGGTPAPLRGPRGEPLVPLRAGVGEGVLLGGNLAVLTRLIGTPYLPDLSGALLFLEDVGEPPYRVDAMLAHLKLAGHLDGLAGVILGAFTEGEPPPGRPTLSLEQVLEDYFREAPYPVATGLVYGHIPVKNTLPVGVRARLEVTDEEAALSLLEPVVALP